eukprot:scaffold1073_cov179-Ochromonas_danica.AAC.3
MEPAREPASRWETLWGTARDWLRGQWRARRKETLWGTERLWGTRWATEMAQQKVRQQSKQLAHSTKACRAPANKPNRSERSEQ